MMRTDMEQGGEWDELVVALNKMEAAKEELVRTLVDHGMRSTAAFVAECVDISKDAFHKKVGTALLLKAAPLPPGPRLRLITEKISKIPTNGN